MFDSIADISLGTNEVIDYDDCLRRRAG